MEEVIQANLPRISEAIRLFGSWATARGLFPSPTAYVGRTPGRPTLRFSRGGNPAIEASYRTHWVSPELSEKKRERLAETASRAPELVVVQPLNTEWVCHRCGGSGDLLMMETPGPACLRCVGLDDLEYLPAADALLTRRAKSKSSRHAVVVRFSRTRRRYERQGLLVEPQALADAQQKLEAPRQFYLVRVEAPVTGFVAENRICRRTESASDYSSVKSDLNHQYEFEAFRSEIGPQALAHFVYRLSSLMPNSVHSQLKL